MRKIAFLFFAFLLLPLGAVAADTALTRRDGFLLIWQGILRPALETRETPYIDVPKGDRGFEEIIYAKRRGILDDTESFYPQDSLTVRDALLWLFRTRSVDELVNIDDVHLPDLLKRYPIVDSGADLTALLPSVDALSALMRSLDSALVAEEHEVSLYSEKFHGKGTAFGEAFNMWDLTAAHRTYPGNTMVKVTNVANGKSVIVRINDRGPYVEGRDMDLSLASFTTIAERYLGVIHATFQRLGDSSLVGGCNAQDRRYAIRVSKDVHFVRGVPHALALGEGVTLSANKAFVLRGILYPDGSVEKLQEWFLPEDQFTFTPSMAGEYRFIFGTTGGGRREMSMRVWKCG